MADSSDLEASFSLPPREALAFFRAKGYSTGFAWQDVWKQEHNAAFTVAKMMDLDLLRDTRLAVDAAIAEGQTFQTFRDALEPRLVEAGWWGRKEMKDPATGDQREVQLGSARRLRTIYRTNMMTAYAAGHQAQIEQNKAEAPFLMYDAVMDDATRDEHAAWDGTVLPADDPWWATHTPPNGFNCRCSVIQLSGAQAADMGYKAGDKAPPVKTREYTNPRTGEVSQVPVGIDPGFDYKPGASRQGELAGQLVNKAAEAPPEVGAEVIKALTPKEAAAFDSVHREWVDQVLAAPGMRHSVRVVGGMASDDILALRKRGIEPQSAAITMESRMMRGTKADRHTDPQKFRADGSPKPPYDLSAEDWRRLPANLRAPEVVLFDTVDKKLMYVFPPADGSQAAKVVVEINRAEKQRKIERVLNPVRTALKVPRANLREKRYQTVRGELK